MNRILRESDRRMGTARTLDRFERRAGRGIQEWIARSGGGGSGAIRREYAKGFMRAPDAVETPGIVSVGAGLCGPRLDAVSVGANSVRAVEELHELALTAVAGILDVDMAEDCDHGNSPRGPGPAQEVRDAVAAGGASGDLENGLESKDFAKGRQTIQTDL